MIKEAKIRRLAVLGAGESGVGAAVLARKKGFEVFVSDSSKIHKKYKDILEQFELDWEEKRHTENNILNADLVVKSPGIPDNVPLILKINEKGIPVISEIEFASRYTQANIVAITGSNGKTTTTLLTHHLLKEGSVECGIAGNIGDSFAYQVALSDQPVFVLEVSSFQLDNINTFKPHIAVITNITPDHLDRYDYSFEKYIAAKFKIISNQTEEDYLIYDADDAAITEWLTSHKLKSQLIPFSLAQKAELGASLDQDTITIKIKKEIFTMPTDTLALEGKHNIKNAMAAATIAQLFHIRKQCIRESLENFQGAEHRLEKVLKILNVQYINDSKATNVNATYYALDSMDTPTVWIAGGVDKGNDYQSLLPIVREKVRAIICLGVDNSKLIDCFGNVVDLTIETFSMSEAVQIAYKIAHKGDTVLLSPACASFDLFENYEDRGRQFKEAVRKL